MTLIRNLFTILLAFVVTLVAAQSQTVTGKITAEDGSVLPGVNVVEKETGNGTVSNDDGIYTITVNPNATLIFSFVGFASQEVRVAEASNVDVVLKFDVIEHWPVLAVGYGYTTLDKSAGATARLTHDDFNQGNIVDPAQSWQGKVAGLSIYNRGGNPNAESILRIRGMSSFDAEARPLIVVDGVPMATLHNLDPQDIQSITVLKDGASASIYGMRGSNGVILIDTKQGSPARGLSVTYRGEGAASTLLTKQPVLNASESIAIGANNLGSSTDWQDEITRTGISSAHHLVLSAANQSSSFRVATHVRNVEGILLHSGFDQVNTRINVRHRVLNDRLRFDFNAAVTNRKINYSFPEAFRYANTFSPTAPIRFDNGNYYQAILFDNYNPVALLEQNINRGKRRSINYNGKVDVDITDHLTATLQVAQQYESTINGSYYSLNSFYVGQSRGGLARRYTDDSSFTLAEGYLTYSRQHNTVGIDITGGFSSQQNRSESFGAELGNFPNDELGYNALGYSADIFAGQGNRVEIFSTTAPVNKISAGFLRARVDVNDAIVLSTSLRKENANKLGENGQEGWFPSAAINVNLLPYLPDWNFSLFNARIAYGITGSIPTESGLALDKFRYSLSNGGTLTQVRAANPDLTWEKKGELNLGVDVSVGRFSGSVDFYKRRISNLIMERSVDPQVYPSGIRFENAGGLKGKGLELTLQYYAGQSGGITWNTAVVASANNVILNQYPQEKSLTGFLDSPNCGCSTQLVRLGVGEELGQFWGPVFDRVGNNGAPVFKDLNGDGIIVTDWGQALDPTGDFTSLGSAFPSWEIGWSNQLTYRNWELNTFFRGAFGHSLINVLRLANEPVDQGAINTYNRVLTDKAVTGLTATSHNSLYVEKASFLKLDNITLTYTIRLKPEMWLRSVRVFGTVQNAFVITGYTGIDPEPILIDRFPASPTIAPNALTPGVDRNASYSPARTFVVGIMAGI
jgi:TonB-dependent starch-binding outer membrane protein SusC